MLKVKRHNDQKEYISYIQKTFEISREKEEKSFYEKTFLKYLSGISRKKALCIGSSQSHEAEVLRSMGFSEVVEVDLVDNGKSVVCDMHSMPFEKESFDFVYTNVINFSNDLELLFVEMERVLRVGGNMLVQCPVGRDSFSPEDVILIEDPVHDVMTKTKTLFCNAASKCEDNGKKLDVEIFFTKDDRLNTLYEKYGDVGSIKVPDSYDILWKEINEEIQNGKLDSVGIKDEETRSEILTKLSKRSFYLTRVAEVFKKKNIAEVGTSQGWQYYTFCKYVDEEAPEGSVSSCDPWDKRNLKYKSMYDEKDPKKFSYFKGTSKEMSQGISQKDLFYIDGNHDRGIVVQDVFHLQRNQDLDSPPVWIFDDFDKRFGCYLDIWELSLFSKKFKVYEIGQTASGKPSHQVILECNYNIQTAEK